MADATNETISDTDRDALHVLPLTILPLETPSLRRARLIKNVRLESVVEFFGDASTGSGQLDIEALPHEFGWPDVPLHPDLVTLRSLANLPSFDVYSLRVSLRDVGIEVNSVDALRLSKSKNAELTSYMAEFTRPLILNIYGDADLGVSRFEDLIMLFRAPDRAKAQQKLRLMADKLQIEIDQIPKFLEDYGDIFLSLSYYRQCLDHIEPIVSEFLEWLDDMQKSWQIRQDANLRRECQVIQSTLNERMAAITGRFENFDRSTRDLWNQVSADRFHRIETLIKSYHTTIGGVLCALTVKMETWARVFPNKDAGGPARRGEFIMTEIRQGLEKIQTIEDSAPMLADLG